VIRQAPAGFSPRLVAGADLSLNRGDRRGFAAVVVVDAETLESVDESTAVEEVPFPYVPGLLSFRELPPLAAAWRRLTRRPDVVVFDGHGLAHPRRFGLACHGGLAFDVPSIGCAKSILVGRHGPVGWERGSTAKLQDAGEVIGMVVRTRSGVQPVYVSIGHHMDLPSAVDLILRISPRYRVPEPVRRSHRLANALRAAESGT
jgi:deoxyribonuclease V